MKFNKILLKFLSLAFMAIIPFFSTVADAQSISCPSSLTVEQIAHSLIKLELSGVRLEEMEGSPCLDQAQFPHILVVEDFSNETPHALSGYVNDISDVKILSVKEIDSDVHLYEARFEMKVEKIQALPGVVEEKIQFILNKTPEAQKILGCAGVIQAIQNIYLLKKCRKAN